MTKSKYLHIMQNEKVIAPYIEFMHKNFDFEEHVFVLIGGSSESSHPIPQYDNVIVLDRDLTRKINLFKLSKELKPYFENAKKVIIHNFFIDNIVDVLFINQKFLQKCYWVIWGGDMYRYAKKNKSLRIRFFDYRMKIVVSRLGGCITGLKGEYELAQKWYGAKGKHYVFSAYPTNLYKEYELTEKKHDTLNIQVGNSADPANNHEEVFEKLEKYKDANIKIFVPLSYGPKKHADEMIRLGQEKFGDKFYPLTEFMSFEKYLDFLADIDIAIFNHKRQQGMGNIITLLGLGKKVYIRDDITPWAWFKELKLNISNIKELDLSLLDDTSKEKNREIIKEAYSLESLIKGWEAIFKDKNDSI